MFFKKYYRKRKILNPKNLVLSRSTPVSSYNSINANQRQISRTRTDQYNSKLSKVIQFEKKQSLNFLIFEKICKRIIKKKKNYISGIFWTFKSKFQIIHTATYITVFLPDSNNCFYYMLYHISIFALTIFSLFCFLFYLLFLNLLAPRHVLQFSYNV